MTNPENAPVDHAPQNLTPAQPSRYRRVLMHTFPEPAQILERGEGCWVWSRGGTRYLDLFSGIAVNSLGHAHPDIVAAIGRQAGLLMHVSNLFTTDAQVALAERLSTMASELNPTLPARTFLCNSGTEANEAAFKLTRLTGRTKIVAMEGSFHGRTMGALALTHTPKYRTPFESLPGEVSFVPYGDLAALAAAVDDQTAAVVLEPIQGENGVVVPPEGYLAGVREVCDRTGALMWVDEVQTGIGRCGSWLLSVGQGVQPDVITLAKGLGAGFPVGACIGVGRAAELFEPGAHGTTFGGNPLAATVALTTLAVIDEDGLLVAARERGAQLREGVLALQHPGIAGVRGAGLLLGIELTAEWAERGSAVAAAALAAGFIINAPRPSVLRLAPSLVVTPEQIDSFVTALPDLLDAARG